jgi:hypothetical protein
MVIKAKLGHFEIFVVCESYLKKVKNICRVWVHHAVSLLVMLFQSLNWTRLFFYWVDDRVDAAMKIPLTGQGFEKLFLTSPILLNNE